MIAFLTLHFAVFRPTLRLIEKRRTATDGTKEEAEKLTAASKDMAETYRKKMEVARIEGIRKKDEIRTGGEKFKEETLRKARSEAERILEDARQKIDIESKEAELQLRSKSREMGHEIASKILGRQV